MSQPQYALSLFFHITATTVWIGGLLVTLILVWPSLRRTLSSQPALYRLLSAMRSRFYPISNLSLAVLIVTGLFQMTADPNYQGFLDFENTWSKVMLFKHIAIAGMAAAGLMLQYGVAPALERASLLLEHSKGDLKEWSRLHRREVTLTWANAVLGLAVLAFSAWATSL